MSLFITLGIVGAVVCYFIFTIRRNSKAQARFNHKKRIESGDKYYNSSDEKVDYFVDESLAIPRTFGRNIGWIAFKSNDHDAVVNELLSAGKKAYKTNMEAGVMGAYAGHTFISPSIEGWILAATQEFSPDEKGSLERTKELSRKFGEVQHFCNHRVSSYASWVRCINGEIIRAMSIADSEIYFDIGNFTTKEQEFVDLEIANETDEEALEWIRGEGRLRAIADEANVLKMAGHWSVNPDLLGKMDIKALGTIIG